MGVHRWFDQLLPSRWRLAWLGTPPVAACAAVGGLAIWQMAKIAAADCIAAEPWQGEIEWLALAILAASAWLGLMLALLLRELRRGEVSQAALRQSQCALTERSDLLEAILEHMDQGVLVVAPDGIVAACNRRATELLDLPPGLMRSRPTFEAVVAYQQKQKEFANITPETYPQPVRGIPAALVHHERQRPNGTILEITSVPFAQGGMVRTFRDITARRRAEDRVKHLAFCDDLTQIDNRAMILQRLQQAVAQATIDGSRLAVLYLDLDRFKQVNDSRGHAVGDLLLIEVAARIRSTLQVGDAVGRLGGDEFAVLRLGTADAEEARRSAERLAAVVREPYFLEGEFSRIDVTVGVTLFPTDGDTAETLLRRADNALYRAKASGRSTVTCYGPVADHSDPGKPASKQDLRHALEANQFEMAYQPIFDVNTGGAWAFEATPCWQHPTRGAMQPDSLLLGAGGAGLLKKLGRWAMRTACAEAATWAVPVCVTLNFSLLQVHFGDLEGQVVEMLHRSGLAAERLILELPEDVLFEERRPMVSMMEALRTLGVGLTLDRFRSARVPSSHLRNYPFQHVKIDHSIAASMLTVPADMAFIRRVLDMAEPSGFIVVVDGIEEQAQLETVRRLGCGHVQGGLLGRPQSPERTRDYLWQLNRRHDATQVGAD